MADDHRNDPSNRSTGAPPPRQVENSRRADGGTRSDLLHDRRRPGRLRNPSPALIALMRGQSIDAPDGPSRLPNIHTLPDHAATPSAAIADIKNNSENDSENGIRDDLRASRGMITGLGISILLWAALIGGGWLLYALI
jgi:hypothetical protein